MTDTSPITPADILAFWRDAGPERWYTRDEAFDEEICRRFLNIYQDAASGRLAAWEQSDDGALALTILLDQFPRNMFRSDARAFATDEMARDVADRALGRGTDLRIEQDLRQFLYMPFMHAEDMDEQNRCVALFRHLGNPDNLNYAIIHANIIRRFGRFPHRNAALGRTTTKDEQDFLDSGGFSG